MRISSSAKRASADLLFAMSKKGSSFSDAARSSAVKDVYGSVLDLKAPVIGEGKAGPETMIGLTETESQFFAMSKVRGMKVHRAGWPDFLVEMKGKFIGVEVKSTKDRIRRAQRRMFEALEGAGIQVFIYWERCPNRLIHWRRVAMMMGVR